MTPPDDRRTITATEAQHTLGVKAATVRKWASRGRLHAVSIGPDGQRWYRLDQVLELAHTGS
jgi:predicted site-specific integrase-resolvase